MGEIGPRLAQRADAEELRGLAAAQACELREDEPHPVRALGAAPDFAEGDRIDRRLRLDEPLKRIRSCSHSNAA